MSYPPDYVFDDHLDGREKEYKGARLKDWMTLPEWARHMGISYDMAKGLQASGKVRTIKVGRQARVLKEEIDRFNREGNTVPVKEKPEVI